MTLETDGVRTTYDVSISGDDVDVDGPTGHARLTRKPRFTDPADAVASGSLLAPMPGTVVSVAVEKGAEVTRRPGRAGARGDEDAAHRGGAVRRRGHARSTYSQGQQVAAGDVLAVVSTAGGERQP